MSRLKGAAAVFACAAASVFLLTALIIISVEAYALNENFYKDEYEKLDTAQSAGMTERDLTDVTQRLISYTRGEAESLDMKAYIGGGVREVFGEREKEHMVDVRGLYLSAKAVRMYGLITAVILIVCAVALKRKYALPLLCRSFLSVSGAFLALVGAAGLWAALDFPTFWTTFHHIFFTNDLWILNPKTDVLIMMVPQRFFYDLVLSILTLFASLFAVLNAAAATVVYINKKKAGKGTV
ncbi:MAG: TIGR01906 family membrane protein [Christensenellales bacterium]